MHNKFLSLSELIKFSETERVLITDPTFLISFFVFALFFTHTLALQMFGLHTLIKLIELKWQTQASRQMESSVVRVAITKKNLSG